MHEFKQTQKYFHASSDWLGMPLGTLGSTVRNAIAGRSFLPQVPSQSHLRLVAAISHEATIEEVYQPIPEEVKDLQMEATCPYWQTCKTSRSTSRNSWTCSIRY